MNKVGRKPKIENIKVDILNEWLQKDVNRIAAIKCQSIISLKNGVSVNDVCKVLNVTRESVRLWRQLIEEEGPDGFISHPKTGRKSGLTQEIKDLLREAIHKNPTEYGFHQVIWDGKLVCNYLEKVKNIHISVRTAQNWLKIIGFTRQIPRKQYRQTDEIENEIFEKKLKKKFYN